MSKFPTIALDAMGGDIGPDVVLPAAVEIRKKYPELNLILVGQEDRLQADLASLGVKPDERLTIHHASQVVDMDESASSALRGKKDSSMRVALNLVKQGDADACVSAGNTGALMATGRFVLKMLPGIDRPAIISALPSMTGHSHMLDLGANVDCTSEQLFQFAVMGSVLSSVVDNVERPRIGLLNIGEEEIKGNERVKLAAQLISASKLNYVGFVEGDDIYKGGAADVIVCDGFIGNVSLKTSEGLARMVGHFLKQEFNRNILTRLMALVSLPVLKAFKRRIDARRYNGASLLGLRGIVIKSHGGADILAFGNAIEIAIKEIHQALPERINAELEGMMSTEQPA
ncbi:MAG TPA: phosphate acyltransferase PlsX [Gammaproteobacteria bacterium]|nr:phosphate acyltransferase PlsX [Gammaproteobacteria bacterium]